MPEKGKWELPGDFIAHEDPATAVLRLLEHQTNLTGTAHFLTIFGDENRDSRDHNVCFFFLIKLDAKSLRTFNVESLEMNPDGSLTMTKFKRSAIDNRISPQWAWWYPVGQLSNWYEKDEIEKHSKEIPNWDDYEHVNVAFDHSDIFKYARAWLKKNGEDLHVAKVEIGEQPLNRGNSALTTDIIVIRKINGKFEIALIERGNDPFKGRKAFPGGFVNYKETPKMGAIRELLEETHLTGSETFLLEYKGSVERDPIQHTVTCVHILKADASSVEKLHADDDAADAKWYDLDVVFGWPDFGGVGVEEEFDPLSVELKDRMLSFDHAIILQDFRKWWLTEGMKGGWFVEA